MILVALVALVFAVFGSGRLRVDGFRLGCDGSLEFGLWVEVWQLRFAVLLMCSWF